MTAPQEIVRRPITVHEVRTAAFMVVYQGGPHTVQDPEPRCNWPKLCGTDGCRFPRYTRNGAPVGLVAMTLIQLGFTPQLLLELDREHQVGEILHPGAKISRSRNSELARVDDKGLKLLQYLQEHQQVGLSWADLLRLAFGPTWSPKFIDRRRRPWLY